MSRHELEKKVLRFARAALDDDHVINENAYNHLLDLLDYLDLGKGLIGQVDAVDGRFFIDPVEE
jgi:hypothetical protein